MYRQIDRFQAHRPKITKSGLVILSELTQGTNLKRFGRKLRDQIGFEEIELIGSIFPVSGPLDKISSNITQNVRLILVNKLMNGILMEQITFNNIITCISVGVLGKYWVLIMSSDKVLLCIFGYMGNDWINVKLFSGNQNMKEEED